MSRRFPALTSPTRRDLIPFGFLIGAVTASFAQNFDAASVKVSSPQLGRDYQGPIVIGPAGLTAHNTSLRSLIAEAYNVQPHQIVGGPEWLDSSEYDIEAKAGSAATRQILTEKLRMLLASRFRLAVHRETRNLQTYELVTIKRGLLTPASDATTDGMTMRQLADLISVQLTIPTGNDPSKPSIAAGAPVPVIDKTGLAGNYAIHIDLQPEPDLDSFTLWQRFLQDRLGLKLESHKGPTPVIVIESAERVPAPN
jgi:uncharacterized protein (TIGR03435 family)